MCVCVSSVQCVCVKGWIASSPESSVATRSSQTGPVRKQCGNTVKSDRCAQQPRVGTNKHIHTHNKTTGLSYTHTFSNLQAPHTHASNHTISHSQSLSFAPCSGEDSLTSVRHVCVSPPAFRALQVGPCKHCMAVPVWHTYAGPRGLAREQVEGRRMWQDS